MKDKKAQLEQIARYNHLIQSQTGRAVRPYRADGYVNFLNKYGTKRDSSEAYMFVPEPDVSDDYLADFYENSGLFAKIIDSPAEEAVKHGFELKDIADSRVEKFYKAGLEELDWSNVFEQGIKWQRLFGGAIAVMLINDGRGIEEPLDWKHIKSIDDIRVFERSVVEPDYTSMFKYDPQNPFGTRGSRLGAPEFYHVYSKWGNFDVHESRVLEFRNGILPENTPNLRYELWGAPEYVRINKAIRDASVSYGYAPKLLERAVQAVYKMRGLSELLSYEQGEDVVLRRAQVIDVARGLLNTLMIDADGEDYSFQSFSFSGANEIIAVTCEMLSAVTNIPQTMLFGRPPLNMSANDETAMENWYSYVQRIQEKSMKSNLRYLLSVLFRAGIRTGEIDEVPNIEIEFNPLKVNSESEQLDVDLKKAQIEQTKAGTAQQYIDMQVLDATEVRKKLAESDEFDIEEILDDYDEEELFENDPSNQPQPGMPGMEGQPTEAAGIMPQQGAPLPGTEKDTDPGTEGSAAANAPAATKLPQDMSKEELALADKVNEEEPDKEDEDTVAAECKGVGVIVVKDGKILCGTRFNDTGYGLLCGPGGHIEQGETPEQAAVREAQEEFGITPKSLISLGAGAIEPETNSYPEVFLCTDWAGEVKCDEDEMIYPHFLSLAELEEYKNQLYHPFKASLGLLLKKLYRMDSKYDEWLEKNLDEFKNDDEEVAFKDFLQHVMGKTSVDNEDVDTIDLIYRTWRQERDLHARKDAADKDVEWITVNGTPVPLDDEGNMTGKVADKIKSTAKKVKDHITEASAPSMEDDMEKQGFKKNAEGRWEKTTGRDALTDRVKLASGSSAEARKCFAEMPIGTSVKMKYGTFTKTGEDVFIDQKGRKNNTNAMVNSINPADYSTYPVFSESDDVSSSAATETRYSGKTDFKHGSVSKEAAQKRFSECAKNAEKLGQTLTSEEFEGMLGSVKDYNFGPECTMILAAQADPDRPTHASKIFDFKDKEERKTYEKKAEQIERMIALSDKMTEPAYRGIGLNSSMVSEEDLRSILDKLKPGADISFGHLSSWSRNRGTASSYAGSATDMELEEGENYAIVYRLRKPKSLAAMTSIMPEGECLAPKAAKFKVLSVKHSYDEDLAEHSYLVDVEEV